MDRKKIILGWTGVGISLIISGAWAYWGAFENFHEGWYSESLWKNLFMLTFQYMLFPLLFIVLALIALRWKKFGLALHIVIGCCCAWFFAGANTLVLIPMIILPFAALGLLYYFGEPGPVKWAYRLIILVPLIIALAISIPQGIKVSQRINDGDFGMRTVEGKGVTLCWAPRGPGWPDRGVSWDEAQEICKYLSEDGTTVMEDEQNIWRLPTITEAVSSMTLHGENAGGIWNAEEQKATYAKTPDKETPLWDIHSKVIYYWTLDTLENNNMRAYIIVYNGGIYDRDKSSSQDYLSFRAVKDPE